MAHDPDAAAVLCPENQLPEQVDIAALAASQMSIARRIVRISWCQSASDSPMPSGTPLALRWSSSGIGFSTVLPSGPNRSAKALMPSRAGLGIGKHPEQPRKGDQRLVLDDVEADGADRVAVGQEPAR